MMDALVPIFALLAVLAIFTLVMAFNFRLIRNARGRVEAWTKGKGWTPLSTRLAWMGGPWPASVAHRQPVFRIVAKDADGLQREGWVRCASWWGEVDEATWDSDESAS